MFHRFPGAAVLLPSAAVFVICVEAAFGAAVKVAKSGQGIYAKPDETKKAATLPTGTVMEVRNASSAPQGWVQVAVPSCVDLWIFSDSVNNGVVTVTTGRIRSTTGPTAPEVARVPRGGSVTIRGRDGDWFKIAPPASATMWVKADSVVPTSEAPSRVEETSVVLDSSQGATPTILPPIIPTIPTSVAASEPPAPPFPPPPPLPAPTVPETSAAAAPAPAPAPVVTVPATATATAPAPAPVPVVTVPAPTPPAPVTPPPAPVATTTTTPPAPIIPVWQPPETTVAASSPAKPKPAARSEKPVEKPVQAAAKPVEKPVAAAPSQKPVAVTPTTRPASRPVVFPSKPATRTARHRPEPASATFTSSASASSSAWVKPASGAAARPGPNNAPIANRLAHIGRDQTHLPKEPNPVEWTDPNPGTLLPNRRPAAITARVPAAIADEKLSPTYVQGKAGRAVGLLVHQEGGIFRSSRYEILQLSADGTAYGCLAVVVGDAATLHPFVDRAVRIDGTVWWLRSSTPILAVETIAPL